MVLFLVCQRGGECTGCKDRKKVQAALKEKVKMADGSKRSSN